jgi:hypothetical protein
MKECHNGIHQMRIPEIDYPIDLGDDGEDEAQYAASRPLT